MHLSLHVSYCAVYCEGNPRTHVLSGGEAFPASLRPVMQHCLSFSNVYGPTETTVWATHFLISNEDQWAEANQNSTSMPVGKPLTNYFTVVLDAKLQPVPIGVLVRDLVCMILLSLWLSLSLLCDGASDTACVTVPVHLALCLPVSHTVPHTVPASLSRSA